MALDGRIGLSPGRGDRGGLQAEMAGGCPQAGIEIADDGCDPETKSDGQNVIKGVALMIRVLLIAACVWVIPVLAMAGPAGDRVMRPGPLVIAHRGFSQRAPENTLPAFRLALAAQADLVELDYHNSADGVPVVIHDGTLDRTTDARARWGGEKIAVRAKTAADIAGLDAGRWFSPKFQGVRVPTLVDAVKAIQAEGCTLIERKAGDAAALVALLEKEGWTDHVVVQSFDWEFVRDAHQRSPGLVLGALGPPKTWRGRDLHDSEKALSAGFIAEIEGLGARLVVWNKQVDAEAVKEAHRRGMRVWVYTIDDPAEAAQLVALGVDGIITNDPGSIRAKLRAAGATARKP